MKEMSKFVNSPFFITLLGGGFLAVATAVVESSLSASLQQREMKIHEVASKRDMVEKFGEGIVRFLQISYEMRQREMWLRAYQNQPVSELKKLRWSDGRDFFETRDRYESLKSELDKASNPDALCAVASVVFGDSSQIREELRSLDVIMDEYVESWTYETFDAANEAAVLKYQHILDLMSENIQKEAGR